VTAWATNQSALLSQSLRISADRKALSVIISRTPLTHLSLQSTPILTQSPRASTHAVSRASALKAGRSCTVTNRPWRD
jgi:hypothetical protein